MSELLFLAGLLCYLADAMFLLLGVFTTALERFFDQSAVEWRELFTEVVCAPLFSWLLVVGGHAMLLSIWLAA